MDLKVLKLKVTNCYLVGIGNQYLLVDTGYEYEWTLFCKRLRDAADVGGSILCMFLLSSSGVRDT